MKALVTGGTGFVGANLVDGLAAAGHEARILRRESSRLGIGFGEQYVSQGYGSEALLLFLRYYFRRLGFERMVLDVAAINLRALRLYERCGFERVGSSYEPLPYQADIGFLNEDAYRHLMRCYSRMGRRNQALREFKACQVVLQRELGVSPMRETVALYERIAREEEV